VLEGAARPGHFSGVATVVSKLLNLVQPDVTVFGEKDYQQLLLVRRLVEDLSYSVEVMAVPTVREADGLALSSRNDLLDAAQRRQAPALHRALSRLVASVGEGVPVGALEARALAELQDAGLRPDYVALRRADDLAAPSGADGESLIALAAAWVGSVRLIDNLRVR
jgi:pantoate--beta-alanine ligase